MTKLKTICFAATTAALAVAQLRLDTMTTNHPVH